MTITEEQLKERANYLGGSDVAKILGRSRWGTPLSTFMAKVHPNRDDSENCIGGKNEASYWGNELEDKVAEAFTKVTGKKVARVNQTLVHPEHFFIRANIDRRVVGEDAILECKTCSAYKAQEWEDDEIPEEYILQVQHYLAVTGNDVAYVAVLIGGQKFLWKECRRDDELIKMIVDAEVNFWTDFVVPQIPPMATGSDKDSDILDNLYPESIPDSSIEMSSEVPFLIEERKTIMGEIKAKEDRKAAIENFIKESLQANELGLAGPYRVTWKSGVTERLDTKRIKAEAPEIWEKFKYESPSRTLRFGLNKPNKKKGE